VVPEGLCLRLIAQAQKAEEAKVERSAQKATRDAAREEKTSAKKYQQVKFERIVLCHPVIS
jgi:hypothetical protein